MTQTEALKLALEALEREARGYAVHDELQIPRSMRDAITAIKEALAQPEQKQNLKLMPREATPEMLKAMDECSTEGYDERLYAGHAGSVYMAAWDAFYGQHCYCGDITNLGVIHRDDGPCHYPEHTSEYKRGYADAMNWKVQNHLEHLQPKVRTGDCLLTGVCASEGHKIQPKEPEQEPVAWKLVPTEPTDEMLKAMDECSTEGYDERLYAGHAASVYMAAVDVAPTPPKPEQEPVAWITQGGKGWLRWHNKNDDHLNKTSVPLYKHPKRKPLSDAEIALISAECSLRTPSDIYFARAIEAAHGIKE